MQRTNKLARIVANYAPGIPPVATILNANHKVLVLQKR